MKHVPLTGAVDVVPPAPAPSYEGGGYAEGDTVALTYRELAARLGAAVTVEAAKARARRGGWAKAPGNDGAVRVQVPVEALEASKFGARLRATGESARPASAPESSSKMMRAALEVQADVHRAELVRMGLMHAQELARLRDAHTAELGRAEARAERATAQEVAARERLAVALAQIERLRQRTDVRARLARAMGRVRSLVRPSREGDRSVTTE